MEGGENVGGLSQMGRTVTPCHRFSVCKMLTDRYDPEGSEVTTQDCLYSNATWAEFLTDDVI